MRIVALSDTHTKHERVQIPSTGDILIHAGDYSYQGTLSETVSFLNWFAQQPQKYKILVPGNHDWLFMMEPAIAREMCTDRDIILALNEYVEIEGLVLYGCPLTPRFRLWAFPTDPGFAKQYWEGLTRRMDILVTHGPPHKMLDLVLRGENVGCPYHKAAIKRLKPDVCIFGHIHLHGGKQFHKDGTSFYNVAICDESYRPSNRVTVIDL